MPTPLCRALAVYCLFVNHPLILRQPSTPIIARPVYWVVLAKPKKSTHNALFAVADKGRSICAKERT